MDAFREYIVATAHVAERHAPFYVGWVRQAYALADAEIGTPLSPEAEQEALLRIHARASSRVARRPVLARTSGGLRDIPPPRWL